MSKFHLALFATVVVTALGCSSLGRAQGHERIDGTQAHSLVEKGAKLVDVRTPDEYAAKHLPSAVNIPVQQLAGRMNELEPKDQALVLYCRSGHRSGIAYDELKKAGFSKLYDLGPMSAW